MEYANGTMVLVIGWLEEAGLATPGCRTSLRMVNRKEECLTYLLFSNSESLSTIIVHQSLLAKMILNLDSYGPIVIMVDTIRIIKC